MTLRRKNWRPPPWHSRWWPQCHGLCCGCSTVITACRLLCNSHHCFSSHRQTFCWGVNVPLKSKPGVQTPVACCFLMPLSPAAISMVNCGNTRQGFSECLTHCCPKNWAGRKLSPATFGDNGLESFEIVSPSRFSCIGDRPRGFVHCQLCQNVCLSTKIHLQCLQCLWMSPNVSQCLSMSPNVSLCLQMSLSPNVSKCLWMSPMSPKTSPRKSLCFLKSWIEIFVQKLHFSCSRNCVALTPRRLCTCGIPCGLVQMLTKCKLHTLWLMRLWSNLTVIRTFSWLRLWTGLKRFTSKTPCFALLHDRSSASMFTGVCHTFLLPHTSRKVEHVTHTSKHACGNSTCLAPCCWNCMLNASIWRHDFSFCEIWKIHCSFAHLPVHFLSCRQFAKCVNMSCLKQASSY